MERKIYLRQEGYSKTNWLRVKMQFTKFFGRCFEALTHLQCRNVARKSSIGGFYVRAGGVWHSNLTKNPVIYSVSYFNLVGLEALFGGVLSLLQYTQGDPTFCTSQSLKNIKNVKKAHQSQIFCSLEDHSLHVTK